MNRIIEVKEIDSYQLSSKYPNNSNYRYDGYMVDTEDSIILVLINNVNLCCENWGILTSDDNLGEYTGAIINDIAVVDKALNETIVKDLSLDEGEAIFVNFNTNKGILQLGVYNAHNGYYGHAVKIIQAKKEILHDGYL